MLERTFCMIKPDGMARGLASRITGRIEKSGLQIIKSRELNVSAEQAQRLYLVHQGKPFYDGLVKMITSGPVRAMIIEGDQAIGRLRSLMGATDPRKAEPGTIRGDLKEDDIFTADGTMKNLIHGSDSKESAEYESSIFF